ncbi:1-acyl-sn-glycerol-3-phosphate acyltransferase [Amphritea japonica]|uniref:1-acyl-sn-glycerol-3-phosphate acyltransferase n=1 Tax=Amphritea japonica TaxID=452627 RepID=UPI00039F9AB3|nr:1-acyl-sn-glycerol-3-phosphate acyltransferase [Amphritea japonica]
MHYFLAPWFKQFYRKRTLRTSHILDDKLSHGFTPQTHSRRGLLIDKLLSDPDVIAAIAEETKIGDEDVDAVHKRAGEYAEELVPSFNVLLYFRLGYWLARSFLRFLYWVKVGYSAEKQYDNIDPNSCIVIVSNHRSNFDPFFLIYLASRKAAISYSAGEWARGFPFQQLLHAIGFYIIRRDSGSALYRKMLERYVSLAVSNCIPQGLFIEGGLSRDGKMQPLKLGMLNYVTKAMGQGNCKDIIFIPTALNYDKIPEDKTLLAHQEQGFKQKGRFYSLLSFSKFLLQLVPHMLPHQHKPFGYACVNYGDPISLQQWQRQHGIDLNMCDNETRKQAIGQLGEDIAQEIEQHLPILPVSILSAIFLNNLDKPISELDLKAQGYEIFIGLREHGRYMLVPKQDEDYALEQGLYTLSKRKMITEVEEGLFQANSQHRAMFEYYRNSLGDLQTSK